MNPNRRSRPAVSRVRSTNLTPAATIGAPTTSLVPMPTPSLSSGPVVLVSRSPVTPLTPATLTTRRPGAALPATFVPPVPRRRGRPIAALPAQDRFPMATVDFSQPEMLLPYGMPSVINAATLKAMAGATWGDRLLKQTGTDWAFVPDDALIDLRDPTQRYKLGRLTILS